LKQLWAPWRLSYVRTAHEKGIECFLCKYPKLNRDEEYYILKRGEYCFIILNRYPYNNGHLMIAPYRHVVFPNDLKDEEQSEIFKFICLAIDALRSIYSPDGFNIGLNIGRDAGAGCEHLHFHVVPRWRGDTNFMPVLSDVKVISQHLRETYIELKKVLDVLN